MNPVVSQGVITKPRCRNRGGRRTIPAPTCQLAAVENLFSWIGQFNRPRGPNQELSV